MARLLPSPLISTIFILSFTAYLVAGNPLFGNPDTPWHLMAGDVIRASGVPENNAWSYAAAGTPWYNLSWAWDAMISAVVACCGLSGLYIFTAAAAASILSLLGYTLKSRGMISDAYILLTLLLVWYVLLVYFYPQPWLATLFLTVLSHHLLHLSRGQNNWQSLRWLPLLMVAWVNLHGGFIVGLSLVAAYAIEAQQKGQQAWFRRLCAVLALCGMACFINPYGVHIVTGFLRTMDSVITPYLADWHPVMIGSDISLTLLLLIFICCTNLRDARMPLADKILAVAWLIYGLHTRRNFVVFAIVAAPYFAYSMQEFARYAQGAKFKTVETFIADSFSNRKKFFAIALGIVAAVTWTPLQTWLLSASKLSDDPYGVRPALAALKPHAKTRFINDYNIGGYLIYASGGTWPVLVDGRAGTAYSEEVLQDSINFSNLVPGYEKLFEKYQADGVITLNTHRFAEMVRQSTGSGWKQVYAGESVSAYVRQRK